MSVGDVHWVELPPADGREQTGRRPAVVIQDDRVAGSLPVVLVIPLTTALKALRFVGTVRIDPSATNGLTQSSAALVFQLRAIDRSRLRERIGSISKSDLTSIIRGLDVLMGRVPNAPVSSVPAPSN